MSIIAKLKGFFKGEKEVKIFYLSTVLYVKGHSTIS